MTEASGPHCHQTNSPPQIDDIREYSLVTTLFKATSVGKIMFSSATSRLKHAISRGAMIGIVVVVIIIIAVGGYAAIVLTKPTSSSSSTTSSSTSGTSFVYETINTPQYLDPAVSYYEYDYGIMQNVYEPLLWYNGTSSVSVIPWLAQNYSVSSDGKTMTINLRQGITFADGEPFNSTAVYFTLNRLLIDDSSGVTASTGQAAWIIQQLLNTSLAATYNPTHAGLGYTSAWVDAVLAQNFVQITGTYSVTLHILHPNPALPYFLSGEWSVMLAPDFVMQKDIALWNTAGSGYILPYPTINASGTTQVNQYLQDWASTCHAGITPNGCGTTYLDGSSSGSMAGTGPYVLTSASSSQQVMTAKSNYWGGPYQYLGGSKITPSIQTITQKYVPAYATRLIDFKNAAKSLPSKNGFTIDVPATNIFDIINKNDWVGSSHTLNSTITGVTMYGPYTGYITYFDPFSTNVTNPSTGTLYPFQPTADLHWRFAIADSTNMTADNLQLNNGLAQVGNMITSPGLPPPGSYNSTFKQDYTYNLNFVEGNITYACAHPLTTFTNINGSTISGVSNSCSAASAAGTTINLSYGTGDTVDQDIQQAMAAVLNNATSVAGYPGIKFVANAETSGALLSSAEGHHEYFYNFGWLADYPWVVDYTANMFATGGSYPSYNSINYTQMTTLESEIASPTATASQVASFNQQMEAFSAAKCLYLITWYPYLVEQITSNAHGVYYNAAEAMAPGWYYAQMSIS
jgi:ABC-type transport system substrate-binding protein